MKPIFNRWIIALVAVAAMTLKFFWPDISEHGHEAFRGASELQEGDIGLSEAEMAAVKGYKLVPARNNADQVRAERMRIVARQGATRTIAFALVSTSPDNDYPNLRVVLTQRDGTRPRVVELNPTQYGHGKTLSHETVELTLEVQSGESKASIEPFYPGVDA